MREKSNCCQISSQEKKAKGFWLGLAYGLLPHSFCIAFVILTIIGATTATFFFKRFLLNPYFFYFLIFFSFALATLSAVIYLHRCGFLSRKGMKRKWRYLAILYGTTLMVNLLFFMVIFPKLANFNLIKNQPKVLSQKIMVLPVTLNVDIPCPGHATLIISELKKLPGIFSVTFRFPNRFEIQYDVTKVSLQEILNLDIFKTYKASIYEK